MTPEERVYQGDRAREVLENEVFQQVFADIEQEIMRQWKESPARDEAGREKLWTYLMLLQKVKTSLENTLTTGKLAIQQINHERKIAELRVPEWRQA